MARTIGDAITRARAAIGDPVGKRADTTTCEGYAVNAINIVKKERPDLFIGKFSADFDALTSASDFPLDSQYFLAVAMFIGAMVESQDDESSDRARGQMLSTIAGGVLK